MAPDIFQHVMDELLGHLPFFLVYLDDILVLSQMPEEHLDHLAQVFRILDDTLLGYCSTKQQT
jgi:hypothetical protein